MTVSKDGVVAEGAEASDAQTPPQEQIPSWSFGNAQELAHRSADGNWELKKRNDDAAEKPGVSTSENAAEAETALSAAAVGAAGAAEPTKEPVVVVEEAAVVTVEVEEAEMDRIEREGNVVVDDDDVVSVRAEVPSIKEEPVISDEENENQEGAVGGVTVVQEEIQAKEWQEDARVVVEEEEAVGEEEATGSIGGSSSKGSSEPPAYQSPTGSYKATHDPPAYGSPSGSSKGSSSEPPAYESQAGSSPGESNSSRFCKMRTMDDDDDDDDEVTSGGEVMEVDVTVEVTDFTEKENMAVNNDIRNNLYDDEDRYDDVDVTDVGYRRDVDLEKNIFCEKAFNQEINNLDATYPEKRDLSRYDSENGTDPDSGCSKSEISSNSENDSKSLDQKEDPDEKAMKDIESGEYPGEEEEVLEDQPVDWSVVACSVIFGLGLATVLLYFSIRNLIRAQQLAAEFQKNWEQKGSKRGKRDLGMDGGGGFDDDEGYEGYEGPDFHDRFALESLRHRLGVDEDEDDADLPRLLRERYAHLPAMEQN